MARTDQPGPDPAAMARVPLADARSEPEHVVVVEGAAAQCAIVEAHDAHHPRGHAV